MSWSPRPRSSNSSVDVRHGWLHRVQVGSAGGWVVTERIRTLAVDRFRRHAPEITLSEDELAQVRCVLAQMLTL